MTLPRRPSAARVSLGVEALESRRLMAFADVDPSWGKSGLGPEVVPRAEQRDGKILAVESVSRNASRLVRLNADGSLDPSFSVDGKVTWPASIVAAKQISDGRIVIAYTYRRVTDTTDLDKDVFGYGVARFYPGGSVDRSFGNDGSNVAAFHEEKIGRFPEVADVAIADDGTAYVGVTGNTLNVGNPGDVFSSFVVKFDAKGRLDTTFDGDGVLTVPGAQTADRNDKYARTIDSLELRDNNTLLVAGVDMPFRVDRGYGYPTNKVTALSAYVTRFTPGGKADNTFGTNGTFKIAKVLSNNDDNYYYAGDDDQAKLLRQSDGRLLLVTRVAGRARVLTLTADGRLVDALSREQADIVVGTGRLNNAVLLANGDLAVTSEFSLYLARRTGTGYVFQQPRLPARGDGRPVDSGYFNTHELLALRDGKLLATPLFKTIRLSTEAVVPRQDDLPSARQTTMSASFTDSAGSGIPELDVFYHDVHGGLKYRLRSTTGRWGDVETVDPADDAGRFLSAVGNTVAYTDGNTGDLKLAKRRKDGTWKVQTIDSAGATGYYCSLARQADGTLAIAYYNRGRGDLMLATQSVNGKWTRETVDAAGDNGRYAKLVVRPDGRLAIAYAINANAGVRLAERRPAKRGGGWVFTDVATIKGGKGSGVAGLDVGYYLTNTDAEAFAPSVLKAAVAYYDAGPGDLVVGYRSSPNARFRLLREQSPGTVGASPHVIGGGKLAVSFYDQTRNQVRGVNVVENESGTSATLFNEPLPIVAAAGPLVTPAVRADRDYTALSAEQSYNYTDDYAWLDEASDVLKVRRPT